MALPRITPRRVVLYLLRIAYGAHILARMWRLSKLPPNKGPLYLFLLKNTDIVLILTGGPVVFRLVQREYERRTLLSSGANGTEQSILNQIVHQLRQVFTVVLLGLGLIKRKIIIGKSHDVPGLVDRLQRVVAEGIQAVNVLDPPTLGGNDASERRLEQ